jgi:putative hydrolase of the HAD superfamily
MMFTLPPPDAVDLVLFDFGAVLYEIDLHRTQQAFSRLMSGPETAIDYTLTAQGNLFTDIETGKISPQEFRAGLRALYRLEATDAQLDEAWNALLIGLYPGRYELVRTLARTHRVALLSNTNKIHYDHFEPQARELFALMSQVFVSFELGCRKPEPQIYLHAVQVTQVHPSRILFIDDLQKNVAAATALGFQAAQLTNPADLAPAFATWLN